MNNWTSFALLTLLLRSILIGFAVWTFVWIIAHSKRKSNKKLLDDLEVPPLPPSSHRSVPTQLFQTIDTTSCGLISLFGLFELVVGLLAMITYHEGLGTSFEYFRFITFIVIPQLLWIPSVRSNRWIRACFALILLFIGLIERATIVLTSLHRDYGMSIDVLAAFGIGFLSDLLVYAVLVAIGIGITKLIGKLRLFQ